MVFHRFPSCLAGGALPPAAAAGGHVPGEHRRALLVHGAALHAEG